VKPPRYRSAENAQAGNTITRIERFALASIHGVDVILLISVIRDRLDKLATLFHFFLSMLFAEPRNHHFQFSPNWKI
jgi:hypothetical protein